MEMLAAFWQMTWRWLRPVLPMTRKWAAICPAVMWLPYLVVVGVSSHSYLKRRTGFEWRGRERKLVKRAIIRH